MLKFSRFPYSCTYICRSTAGYSTTHPVQTSNDSVTRSYRTSTESSASSAAEKAKSFVKNMSEKIGQQGGITNRAGDAAESVKRGTQETLQTQIQRFHAFLDSVRENKDSLQAGANDRSRKAMDNLEDYRKQVVDFEQRMQKNVEGKTNEAMESEWAQKMKSMYESGLDSVVSAWKKTTGGTEEQSPKEGTFGTGREQRQD